jgi:hypothetical protein
VRILVTGSRHGWDHRELHDALHATVAEITDHGSYIHGVDEPMVLVHGAARGVDTQAAQIWEEMKLVTEAHPAKWTELGKRAGPVRNQEMVDSGINLCLAFLDPESRGTKDCVERAEKAGITVRKWTR